MYKPNWLACSGLMAALLLTCANPRELTREKGQRTQTLANLTNCELRSRGNLDQARPVCTCRKSLAWLAIQTHWAQARRTN